MEKVINEKLIKKNKTIGNVTSIVGIAILGAGLVLNLTEPTPTKTIISFAALIVGVIVAQFSTSYVTRFARSPRHDEIIGNNLSKLNNEYTFYVYSGPIPMLLLGPTGIWIPIPVFASGELYFDKKWRQKGGSSFVRFFGQESIGRPETEVEAQERLVSSFLKSYLTEDEIDSLIANKVLVSLHPKSIIGDVENAPTPIVEVNALRRYIRKIDRKEEAGTPPEVLEKIRTALTDNG